MAVSELEGARVALAKRAFSTRRVGTEAMRTLIQGNLRPVAGDLVLARVDELGKQTKLELTDGRRAHMFPGDEIIVSFGNRYAPDQYEAVIGPDMSSCDLVAAGGIAGVEVSRHQRMIAPTKITPIGLIGDSNGQRLNLMQFRVDAGDQFPPIPAVLSLGTSMNAGKTLTATSIVRGLKRAGYKVAALKITGTGAGGDMWIVRDAGADVSLDFTDAGFATTYLVPVSEIERGAYRLLNHAAALGCEIAVIEIADGLQQLETAQLIRSEGIKRAAIGTVFAAYDAMGAKYGVDVLREAGHAVLALSGRLGRSPLGVREAEEATGLRVYTPWELQEGALVPAFCERAAEGREVASFRLPALSGIPDPVIPSGIQALGSAAPISPKGGIGQAGGSPTSAPVSGNASGFGGLGSGRVIDISRVLRAAPEVSHELLQRLAHWIMNREVAQLCGAPFGSRLDGRVNRRNGFRDLGWKTPLGAVPIRVPRVRLGHYQPSFLRGADANGRGPRAEDIDAVVRAAGGPGLQTALADLVAAIGADPLDGPALAALGDDIRTLLASLASLPANSAPREGRNLAPLQRSLTGDVLWLSGAGRRSDEAEGDGHTDPFRRAPMSAVSEDLEIDEDDSDPGLAFQRPHAIPGE